MQVPALQLVLSNDENKQFCLTQNVELTSVTPVATSGDWYHMNIPISSFNCGSYPGLGQLDRFDFQNGNALNALFCVADLQILSGGASATSG